MFHNILIFPTDRYLFYFTHYELKKKLALKKKMFLNGLSLTLEKT